MTFHNVVSQLSVPKINQFLIYGLTDPRTKEVRYVGQTTKGMDRPKQHLQPYVLNKEKSHKAYWLKQLLANGLSPIVVVLETADDKDHLNELEVKWISSLRICGSRLTNVAPGGTGYGNGQVRTLSTSRSIVDENGTVYESVSHANEVLNLSPGAINQVLRGATTTAGGLTFSYKDGKPANNIDKCDIFGCDNIELCSGLCVTHYARRRSTGDPLKTKTSIKLETKPTRCKVDECSNQICGLGYCGMHYKRFKTNGDPLITKPMLKPPHVCGVADCTWQLRVGFSRGYCSHHYNLLKATGSTSDRPTKPTRLCTAIGCGRKHYGLGFCQKHYQVRDTNKC